MGLEQVLQAETVGHLDLSPYLSVEGEEQVKEVLQRMREDKRNCVMVMKQDRLIGIFTERDVLTKVVDRPEVWNRPIHEVMTPAPQTVGKDDEVHRATDMMNKGHFRNIPVVDSEENVVGNLTHYAIIKFLCDRFPQEIYNLPPEPDQTATARDGA